MAVDVRFPAYVFISLLVLAKALTAARAQPPQPPEPATLVHEALASPYGKALIAELGNRPR